MIVRRILLAASVMAATSFVAPEVMAAGAAPQPTICVRSCWGARAAGSISYMSALNRAVIHHTANAGEFNTTGINDSKANVRNIQNYHKDINGWSDIGYHFLVDKLGNTFEGRYGSMTSLPRGAHDGVNSNSFGFTLMCYAHTPHNQNPPTAMRQALYNVIAWRMPNGWSPVGTSTYNGQTEGKLCGHRDVGATACPGDIFYGNYLGTNTSGGEARTQVAAKIAGGGSATNITVDNSSSGFSVTGVWSSGASAADKYGADYRFHSTAPVSEPAQWTANIPTAGNYDILAWWPQGTNRSSQAPYILPDNSSVPANQQANGGKFNLLGTRNLSAGSKTVKLSVWAPTGYVVMADAIRFYGPK